MTRFALLLMLMLVSTAAWADNITLYSSYSVEVGAKRQLTAYVPLSPNKVSFTVNGIPGGNAVVGTVSANGLYIHPGPGETEP